MNLRRLLKRESQRQLQMIELLYYSKHPRSSEELAKLMDCTIPVILSDIRSINLQSEYYKITRDSSLYQLELKDNATIDVIFSTMLNNSLAFRILEALLFEESYTLKELSKKAFCSLSNLQYTMKKVEDALAKWKITIYRRPFRIVGDEVAIRHLFFLYFSEKKVVRENTRFSMEFFKFGDGVIRSMIEKNHLSVSLGQYNRLSITFFVSLVRISRGHRMMYRKLRSTAIVPPSYRSIKNFSPYLRKELHLVYLDDVMKDSFWLLYSDLFLLGEEQKNHVLLTNHALAFHYEVHYELVERLSGMLVTPLNEEQQEQLIIILINQHLFHARTKEFISVLQDPKKDCITLLETFHAHCVHQLRNLVIDFTEEYQLFRSPEFVENYIYQIIATIPSCLNGMKKSEKPVNLLVVSTDSKMQESLLTELLRLSIRGNYAIHQINVTQIHKRSYRDVFEEYDLVISSSTFDVPRCKTPIIAVELCPSVQSLNKIQSLVDQMNEQKSKAVYA